MPIPASGRPGAGFSLLELLLVLVVVGLIAALAGLTVSSGSRPYTIDAALRHFADIAAYALDEAQLSGTDMGLLLWQQPGRVGPVYSYQWLQRAGADWQPAPLDEDARGRRELPAGLVVSLEVEQQPVAPALPPSAADLDALLPQALFYSSGETTPGLMSWYEAESGALLWQLEWDLLGRFSLRRRGQADADDEPPGR